MKSAETKGKHVIYLSLYYRLLEYTGLKPKEHLAYSECNSFLEKRALVMFKVTFIIVV